MGEHSARHLWSPKIKLLILNFINLRIISHILTASVCPNITCSRCRPSEGTTM